MEINVVGPPFPALGNAIPIFSAAHQTKGVVTCLMDTTAYKYAAPDWNWVQEYGLAGTVGGGPLPQPYVDHKGTDIQVSRGSDIKAISGGVVRVAGGVYNEVYIEVADGTTDCYLHMDIAAGVIVGKTVTAGTTIGYENGWGAGGFDTYPSHLHLDKYVTAVGRGAGTIDAFNYSQVGGTGEVEIYVKVDNINDWDKNSDKIGCWTGRSVSVVPNATLYKDVSGTQATMQKASGGTEVARAWKGEFGNLQTIAGLIVGNKVQVSVYDQFGAFHPQIWVHIDNINW